MNPIGTMPYFFAAVSSLGINTITGEGLKEALAGAQVVIVSSCLVARCRHETETTFVPGYSFRKCVPTGVGSNLGFDASPLGAWLIRRSTPLCLIAFPTRKYFRACSPSAGVSGCLQPLHWINR